MVRMATCLGLFLGLVVLAAGAATPSVALKFHYDAAESTNAVYHLACLAGHIPCTRSVFEQFWHGKLQWTPADKSELDVWTGILKKVGDAAPLPKPMPYIGNTVSLHPGHHAQHQVIRAALESKSLADFQRRTRHWLDRDEAARLGKAVEHFRERLKPWWQSTGRHAVKSRLQQVGKSLRKYNIPALAGQVAAFVEANPPTRDVYLHAIPGPVPDSDAAGATVVSNHFLVEVISAATPDFIAFVSMHELTHYFYDTAPAAKHVALMQEFVQAEVPHASALYGLLNEALATGVQSLIGERLRALKEGKSHGGKSDDGGYRHPFIGRLGRSTRPVLKEWLAKRSTLYQGFSQAYIREAKSELRGDVNSPKFFLTAAALLPSDKGANAYEVFLREFQPVNFIKSDQWKLFSHLNLVFLVAYDELAGFSTTFPELSSHTNKRGIAYIGSRGGKASVCILAGTDASAITDVVRALAQLQSVPSSGLLLSID